MTKVKIIHFVYMVRKPKRNQEAYARLGFLPKQMKELNNTNTCTCIEWDDSVRCDTRVGSKTKEIKQEREELLVVDYKNFQLAFKVHLTPKYFFCSNKSLHLFETHCSFLPRFNPNLDFLQAVKVTKSVHYLLHDRASKGYGSIPGWTSQTDLHRIKSLSTCKQRRLWHQPRNRPKPLTFSVVQQMMGQIS